MPYTQWQNIYLFLTCLLYTSLPEKNFDLSEYAKTMFSMFGGEETEVSIRFHNDLVGAIFDRFGTDVRIIKLDENHFITTIKVAISPHFLSWIISLDSRAKIVSQDWVQEKLYELILDSQKQY